MIQFCTCNKRFTSPLEITEGQESSKSCRSCGGILSVDKLCALSRSMWSTVGPEFPGVIDPQLKWKTSSNAKHRALRRARTFTRYNGKKLSAKNTEDIEDLFDEATKKEGDMLVSESEKLGVSVLGRRFSDNLESVPIKKRRFSLLPPESTPHILSSSSFHDHNRGGCLALLPNSQGSPKHDESDLYSSHRVDWGQEKCSADENRCLEDIDKCTGDSADFSGISILAAAACNSSIEKGFMDTNGPIVRGHSFEEIPSSLRSSESLEGKEDQPSKLELRNAPKLSVASFTAGEAVGREPGQIKLDECNEENSVGSLRSFSRRKLVSFRDDRLHWDLNTVMDVWESQSDDFSSPDSFDACVKSNGSQDTEYENQGVGQDEAVFGIKKVGLIATDNLGISHCSEENDRKHTSPVADCDEGKYGSSNTQDCEPLQEECQFKDVEVMVANAPDKASTAGGGEKSCIINGNVHSIEDIEQLDRDLSTKLVDVSDEEKYETDNVNFSAEVNACIALTSPISTGNATLSEIMNDCDPFSEDKDVKEMLHDDSLSIATVGSCNDHSGECNPAYVGKGNQPRNSRAEKHRSVSADVTISITAQKSPAGQIDQSTSGIIIQGDEKTFQVSLDGSSSKSMKTFACLTDETSYTEEFVKAFADENQSTAHLNSKGTSDNKQLPSRDACINQYKGTSTTLKADDCNSCILSGESLTATRVVSFHTSPELTNSTSEGFKLERNDIPLADNMLISHEECRTPADDLVRLSFKDSLEEHLDSEHYSDAYPIDTDHVSGLEKVEFLGDDDSQYEDGELRESVLNSWGEDGVEEVETEHVDYGSDCRDTDFLEAESDFCSQSDLADGTTECKHEGKSGSTFSDGNKLRVTEDDSSSKYFQKHVNNGEVDARKNLDVSVASDFPARDENKFLSSNMPTDVPGKSSQPDSSRMKSSGWDKLPRREDAAVDSVCNYNGASATTSVNGDYARRMVVSSVRRDSFSRVERSKSSEASCRKEASYATENKKHDRFELNAEKSTNASRSIGRSRLPFRSHGRGRVECWVGSPDHRGSCHFDTSGYYSSPNYAPTGSRNAAAAAVAKVESNGFVVAPDGTIVKPGSAGSGSHLSARLSNSTAHLQSTRRGPAMESSGAFDMSTERANPTREVSPDRCFNAGRGRTNRHDSRFISFGHRNMYHAPMLDQHPSSRRQRSFSPQRRPIHLSREHTRSPSRSKTRSPHTWISPRGRDNGRVSGDPDARGQSRSPPNFMSQRRIPRQRPPQRHVMPAEDLPSYVPSSRSHSSPPHASRCFGDERVLQGHLRERHPRCPIRRSSPARNFLQANRLDRIESQGRVKPDEYYQPIYSGRFHEYAGYGRGSKHDGREDGRRGQNNRREVFHPEGHLESNDNMKCLGYSENGFRSHNLQPKSLGFQRRESPRTFDRSIDAQRKDSPGRIKGEMFHFRRSRDRKSNTDFRSFGVEDTTEDMSLQRRPS